MKNTTEVIMNVLIDDATAIFPSSFKKDPIRIQPYSYSIIQLFFVTIIVAYI